MAKRIQRTRKLSTDEVEAVRAARAEFARQPSRSELATDEDFAGPMSIDEYLEWRRSSGEMPLTKQLQGAIATTGKSLYSIAQDTGIAAPILQRFINGERGITLDTAGKLAAYLGLGLLPESRKQ